MLNENREESMNRIIKRGVTLLAMVIIWGGCLSPDLNVKTSGEFNGTYVSVEGTYSGPLGFSFTQEDEEIKAEGTITVENETIEFSGSGTLSKDPAILDLYVVGTDFTMHIEGTLVNGSIKGSYSFKSSRWGNDEGSVDLSPG
jgi:hypothetical protein